VTSGAENRPLRPLSRAELNEQRERSTLVEQYDQRGVREQSLRVVHNSVRKTGDDTQLSSLKRGIVSHAASQPLLVGLFVERVEHWPVFLDDFADPSPVGREVVVFWRVLFTPTHTS